MKAMDEKWLRKAIEVAREAREHGNHPFGAVLVDDKGNLLLTAENTVITDRDPTCHAETNLVRVASKQFDREFLAHCTLYASTEPCPMCAGAIFWGNIGRVVYGLSEKALYDLIGDENPEALVLSCREVLARGKKSIEVIGPLLEREAEYVHIGFW
jgi:tRNA(Arg) A34 adenosine deaminase TadA